MSASEDGAAPATTSVPAPRAIEPLDTGVRDQIAAILSAKPLARDYKRQVRALLAPLGSEARTRVGNALAQSGLYLPNLSKGAPAVEDATARIRFSYMTMSSATFQQDYVADMLRVASNEDFRVVLQLQSGVSEKDAQATLVRLLRERGEKQPAKLIAQRVRFVADRDMAGAGIWAEDNKWASGGDDDDPAVITTLPKLDRTIIDDATKFADSYEPTERGFQGAVNSREQAKNARTLAVALGRNVKTLRGYNEGGNMLVGTRPDGEAYAILGHDAMIISAMMLLDRKAPEIAARRKTLRAPSPEELAKVTAALAACGRSKTDPLDYLAASEVAADMFAEDLNIARKNLCFVSQPEFHIDMFMRPVAPGVVMLQDDQACIDLLDQAIKKAEATKSWQLGELRLMRANAVALLKKRGALVAKIKKQLQAAGLRVIAAPGVMSGTRKANFMNAVPGSSIGSSSHYYATNASSLTLLQDGFSAFLAKQGFDRVYFLGGAGGSKDYKSSSEYSLDAEGGLDCLENHHEGLRAEQSVVEILAG